MYKSWKKVILCDWRTRIFQILDMKVWIFDPLKRFYETIYLQATLEANYNGLVSFCRYKAPVMPHTSFSNVLANSMIFKWKHNCGKIQNDKDILDVCHNVRFAIKVQGSKNNGEW